MPLSSFFEGARRGVDGEKKKKKKGERRRSPDWSVWVWVDRVQDEQGCLLVVVSTADLPSGPEELNITHLTPSDREREGKEKETSFIKPMRVWRRDAMQSFEATREPFSRATGELLVNLMEMMGWKMTGQRQTVSVIFCQERRDGNYVS